MDGRRTLYFRELSSVGPRGSGLGGARALEAWGDPPEALSGGEYTGTIHLVGLLLPKAMFVSGVRGHVSAGLGRDPFWWMGWEQFHV